MLKKRIIARMDIKGDRLIKPVQMDGVRVVGDPKEYAARYNRDGIDEILFMDAVASLYGRNNLESLITEITKDVFVPVTVGGGIRSLDDATRLLRCGADKIAINTASIHDPYLITRIAHKHGNQAVVLQIDAKRHEDGKWEAYSHGGRQRTGRNAVSWAEAAVELGAGEILVTSIDQEGTRKGFDLDLVGAICDAVTVPVIASGGFGKFIDMVDAFHEGADGIAIADGLHYGRVEIAELKGFAQKANIPVRMAMHAD